MRREDDQRGAWTLFIFDVDGTLVDLAGAGRRAMDLGFRDVFGWEASLEGTSFAGRTDLAIVRGLIRERTGLADGEAVAKLVARVFASYERRLPEEIALTPYSPTPGANELLATLVDEPRALIGLATGNLKSAATMKLESAGVGQAFRFGAFGSDHSEREELVRAAIREGAACIPEGAAVAAWVLGDTPHDVAAALANGARALAVAQGPCSEEALERAGAHVVVPDLRRALDRRFWLEAPPAA